MPKFRSNPCSEARNALTSCSDPRNPLHSGVIIRSHPTARRSRRPPTQTAAGRCAMLPTRRPSLSRMPISAGPSGPRWNIHRHSAIDRSRKRSEYTSTRASSSPGRYDLTLSSRETGSVSPDSLDFGTGTRPSKTEAPSLCCCSPGVRLTSSPPGSVGLLPRTTISPPFPNSGEAIRWAASAAPVARFQRSSQSACSVPGRLDIRPPEEYKLNAALRGRSDVRIRRLLGLAAAQRARPGVAPSATNVRSP